MFLRRLLMLVGLLVVALPAVCAGGQTVSLEPKLSAAAFPARYVYRADSQMYTAVSDMESESESRMEMHFELSGAAPTIELRITRMTLSFDGGGLLDGSFDSSAAPDEKNNLDRICRPLLAQTLTLTVAPTGRIEKVEGLDKIKPAEGSPIQISDLLTPDGLAAMFQPVLMIRPEPGSTRVGQKWYYDQPAAEMIGAPKRRYELTLKSARGDRAEVDIAADPDAPQNDEQWEKASGTAVWDTRRGLLSKLDTQSEARWTTSKVGLDVAIATNSRVHIEREP